MGRVHAGIVSVAFALLLTACGSLHLYDKAADELATKAKVQYDDSKILEMLKGEEANFDALEKKEIDAFVGVIAARRDFAILRLLEDSSSPFAKRFSDDINDGLTEILPTASNADTALDALTLLNGARYAAFNARMVERNFRQQLLDFPLNFTNLPACDSKHQPFFSQATLDALTKATDGKNDALLQGTLKFYQSYVAVCNLALKADKDLLDEEAKFAGPLGIASADARRRVDALARNEADVRNAKAALKTATEEAAAAAKGMRDAAAIPDLTCKADSGAPPATATEPANPICKALSALKALGSLGMKTISEEQTKKVDLTLAALSGAATADDKDALPAGLALLSSTVRFAGALQQYQAANTLPALEPLLIERQLATVRIGYASRAYELEKLRAALAREKYEALLLKLDLLLQARANLAGLRPAGAPAACPKDADAKATRADCVPLSRLVSDKGNSLASSASEPPGRIAFRALAYYAESFSVAEARYQTADLRLIVSDYRDVLISSDAAVASWDALIATPLAQLQAYYASGIKTEEIAQFLQAFGVIGIAAGVR